MAKKPPIDLDSTDSDAQKWLKKLESAKTWQKKWKERAEKVVKRYRDERGDYSEQSEVQASSKFNILYANTQVLEGVVYQRSPIPDVRRRYKSDDPVGRVAAQVLERALAYEIDSYDFDGLMKANVEDLLLPGRAVSRVKYKPTMVPMEDGQGGMIDKVVYEESPCEYVEWDMFLHEPARRWSKVNWIAFGELLTRDDLISQFGAIGKKVPLNWAPKDTADKEIATDPENHQRRALTWTIWDKTSKTVKVVSEGFDDFLKEADDPLRLEQFYPIPKPMLSVYTNNSLIPIPEFCVYQDQADELDRLTSRITNIIDTLRRRGVYDGGMVELSELANAGDNKFIPVQNYAAFVEKGGLKRAFDVEDVKPYSDILVNLYAQREQCKQIIYEVTGISDIIRGASSPSETATAQQIKEKYGSVRVQWRQKMIQTFARDVLRLKAEIIAEHFSQETLQAMTGIQLPTSQDKQMAMMQAQQSGQPPDDALMKSPTWEDVMGLLRNEKLRGFRIDIETDSTISLNDEYEKEGVTDFLTALGQIVSQMGPAVQQGYLPMEVAKKILMFAMRKFRATKDVEDALEQIGSQPPPQQGPDPAEMAKVQIEQQKLQQAQTAAEADFEIEKMKMTTDAQIEQQKLVAEQQKAQLEAQTQIQIAQIKAENDFKIEQMKLAVQDQAAQRNEMLQLQLKAQEVSQHEGEQEKNHQSMVGDIQKLVSETKNTQGMETISQALMAMIERMNTPKRIIKDKNGEITGIAPVTQ